MSNYLTDGYYGDGGTVANAPDSVKQSFIRRTYLHLAGSVALLVGMEALLLRALSGDGGKRILAQWFGNPISLLVVLGLFIAGGFLARWMARGDMPPAVKYLGLFLYTCMEAIFLLPILYVASMKYGMAIINQAAILTLVTFAGLTLTVFLTKMDFSGLGRYLALAGWLLFALVLTVILGKMMGFAMFGLGLWFSFLVIALAAGYILYDTSNIMHHYAPNEHVGASLELLADVVLLFYHILRVLYLSRDD